MSLHANVYWDTSHQMLAFHLLRTRSPDTEHKHRFKLARSGGTPLHGWPAALYYRKKHTRPE
jgi:hypothetical protein